MNQTYTTKIAKNSFWVSVGFLIVTLCNFTMSVIVTRYFGKEVYGQYGYFLWLASTLAILASFGLQQALNKFIPKYFFAQKEPESSAKARLIFQKLITVQIFGALTIAVICFAGIGYLENIIRFSQPNKIQLLIIIFLAIVPLSLNNFLNTGLTSTQEFKKLARSNILNSIVTLLAIILLVNIKASIVTFLWVYLLLSFFLTAILLFQTKKLREKTVEVKLTDKLFSYSFYGYIGNLSTQIVWERSEILFLGLFSDSNQIAIYTLAYSLAILYIGAWGALNSVLNATTAEVLLTNQKDKLDLLTQHGTKYLAIGMLPLALLASLFLGDLVTIIYGKSFQDIALLFPPLVLAHAIAIIITPAGSIPMLQHEMRKTMFFNIATAAVNIALAIYLITKYQAVGAMLANVISQIFSITLALLNAKKYGLGIFNKYTVRVFLLNAAMATIFLISAPYSFAIRTFVAGTAAASYIFLVRKTCLNQEDTMILQNIFKT